MYCSSLTKSSKFIQAEIVNESVVIGLRNLFGSISICVSPSNFKYVTFSFLIESVIFNLSNSYSLSILGKIYSESNFNPALSILYNKSKS